MTRGSITAIAFAVALSVVAAGQSGPIGDWPQWRGPNRDGRSQESGLLKQWPAAGPPRLWSISSLGYGYGSVSLKGDRIFVQGSDLKRSIVFSLNRADGKGVWSKALGAAPWNDRGGGPRGTPTIDDDRVYVLTENGDLACLKAADGTSVWQRNILRDFRGNNLQWLISESPLVDGDKLIVTPGGPGASVVALDKMTGATIWTSKELSDSAGYASLVAADVQGVRVVTTLTAQAAVGLRESDGKLMWKHPRVANDTANVTTPIVYRDKVFYSSDYGTGAVLLRLASKNGDVAAEEIYFTREMQNHHGGVLLVDGYLYGFNNSILTCLDFATGKMMWRHRSVGKGSLTYADGRLYLIGEDNIVGLAEASPTGYREVGRFAIPDEGYPSWAHPVVSGGRLYIRNQGTLSAYDVQAR